MLIVRPSECLRRIKQIHVTQSQCNQTHPCSLIFSLPTNKITARPLKCFIFILNNAKFYICKLFINIHLYTAYIHNFSCICLVNLLLLHKLYIFESLKTHPIIILLLFVSYIFMPPTYIHFTHTPNIYYNNKKQYIHTKIYYINIPCIECIVCDITEMLTLHLTLRLT